MRTERQLMNEAGRVVSAVARRLERWKGPAEGWELSALYQEEARRHVNSRCREAVEKYGGCIDEEAQLKKIDAIAGVVAAVFDHSGGWNSDRRAA